MRSQDAIARVTSTVLLVFVPLYAEATPTRPARADASSVSQNIFLAGGQQPSTIENGNAGVEVLNGPEGLRQLANLKARKAAAFRRAEAAMTARGFRPTKITTTVRSLSLASLTKKESGPIRLAASDGSGEITVWSWDDGDDSTWEGTIYVERYNEGSTLFNTQILIDAQDALWTDLISYDLSGGPIDQTSLGKHPERRHRGEKIASLQHIGIDPAIRLVQSRDFHQKVRDWLTCGFFWCTGAAVGCIYAGPLWFPCFMAACVTALIGCAETLFR